MQEECNLLVVLGPTASGKTTLATNLAIRLNGEIISADSRQVYKGMDLGTGKDYEDYLIKGEKVPYHLIDIVEPGYKYNVFEYQTDFFNAFDDINKRERFPIMCGGSGMYIEAVLNQYKLINVPVNDELRKSLSNKSLAELTAILSKFKKLHNNSDTDTVKRAIRNIEIETYYTENPEQEVELPKLKPLIVGVGIDRELRREKITRRLKQRIEEGMVEEVKGLLGSGVSPDDLIYYGLEYKFLTLYVLGKIGFDEMFEQLNVAIHQFAKRQMTWYRRMERHGTKIHWINANDSIDEKVEKVINLL